VTEGFSLLSVDEFLGPGEQELRFRKVLLHCSGLNDKFQEAMEIFYFG